MANSEETTFEDFQRDERFKRLNRTLKLAVLRKAHSDNGKMLPINIATNRPSVSSINADNLDTSCTAPSLQTSAVRSEVLATSNNLKNLLLVKRGYKINSREITATSSVKQYNVKQDGRLNDRHVMPPPMRNTIYRTCKEMQKAPILSNYQTTASNSCNRSVQSSTVNSLSLKSAASCISANINTNNEYLRPLVAPMTPTNESQKIDRIFSNWRVMLTDRYELIIKGTLECGRFAYSKPVIRRYTATCVESKYKHRYSLQGNIVDERHVLPDYIRGKFYNGFPDDWENVYQIWRTYVSQGCPMTFRWPTPITDSDDDLNSELTELTYTPIRNSKTIPMETYESIEKPSDKSLKDEEKYHNCATRFKRYEKNASFVKPLISNIEKDVIPTVQTRNMKENKTHDEANDQNIESSVDQVISSRGMNKLKDIIHEDKLHIIINNLADRNCSPKYIDKIIEMFECLDYAVSYRTKSEYNDDSAVLMNCGTSSKPETIPLQSSFACDDNTRMNTNKLENGIMEQSKNYMHSTDLRYESIKDDSNPIQSLSNPTNIKFLMLENNKNNDSDESESGTYAGIPKISKIEQVLQDRRTSKKVYKHKVRKKPANLQSNAKEIECESIHAAIPIADDNKGLFSDESGVSITEDEVKVINPRKCHEVINVAQRSRENIFCNHPEKNFDGANKPAVQNQQLLDAFEVQKVNLNAFRKEQNVPHKIQENAYSQFFTDIDYAIDSDIDGATVNMKRNGNMIASHSNLDQNIMISSESNYNFPEKSLVLRKSRREFIESPRSETATKRCKPNIISLLPVNLKLKIKSADSKPELLQTANVNVVENEENKQYTNIQSSEENQKKKSVSSMIATKATVANDPYSKTVDNDKKKISPTTTKKNESNINPTNLTKPTTTTNPTIEQSKSLNENQLENNSKVLCAWMPKVMYYAKSKSELGLAFEGKLLNEVGHVVHRKFMTDIVLKRLSPTLIETVNHEFYKLVGHLKDNKHVIPKELAKQCRNGCPANIEQFCLTWKKLQNCKIQKMSEKPYDPTSMDLLNTSISSRGRKIVPPLSYWTGERITLKDNNLIYDPGSSQESSLYSLIENSKEALTEKSKKQKVNSKDTSKKQKLLSKSNEISGTSKNQTNVIETTQASNKSPKTKAVNGTKRSYKSNNFRKSRINGKRIKQNSSTDSSEEEQKVPPSKRMHIQLNTEAPSQYTMTLRKRYDRGISK